MTRIVLTGAAALGLILGAVGCGSSSAGSRSHPTTRPSSPRARQDIGLPSQGNPRDRVCGYMKVGSFTASDVTMAGLTCQETARLIKDYLSGKPLPPGVNASQSCDPKLRGGPPGTDVHCAVRVRASSGAIRFFKGGRAGHPPPQPLAGLDPPGDERNFGYEAGSKTPRRSSTKPNATQSSG